jgi:hypothetical protein
MKAFPAFTAFLLRRRFHHNCLQYLTFRANGRDKLGVFCGMCSLGATKVLLRVMLLCASQRHREHHTHIDAYGLNGNPQLPNSGILAHRHQQI